MRIFTLTVVSFDLQELMYFLLALAGVFAIVAFGVAMVYLAKILSRVSRTLRDSAPAIVSSLENVDNITGNLVDVTDDIAEIVPETLCSVNKVVSSATDVIDDAATTVGEVSGVLNNILGIVRECTDSLGSFTVAAKTVIAAAMKIKNVLPAKKKKIRILKKKF